MFNITYYCVCIYCMLQLSFLLVMSKSRQKGRSLQKNSFSVMLFITLLSFAADILSTLNHSYNWMFPFAAAGNYIEIILNTILLPIYFLYICMHISELDVNIKERILTVLWILTILSSAIVISTAFNSKVFYFDQARNYHRGTLFLVPMFIQFVMMVIIEVFIIIKRTKIEVSYYNSLVVFLLLPLIGWGLQVLIYGMPFALISLTFAAQVVYINIQNHNMDTDYLTGAYNRKSLDIHLQNKIDSVKSRKTFSALMLDLDNFKAINDTYGHYEGDVALISTIEVLRSVLSRKDFIARYGGDEFCVVLSEENEKQLAEKVDKIYEKLQDYNRRKRKPYELSFSIGFAVYDPLLKLSIDDFFKVIDMKMYEEKKFRKTETQDEQLQ